MIGAKTEGVELDMMAIREQNDRSLLEPMSNVCATTCYKETDKHRDVQEPKIVDDGLVVLCLLEEALVSELLY
jgi:hypothetical protein